MEDIINYEALGKRGIREEDRKAFGVFSVAPEYGLSEMRKMEN